MLSVLIRAACFVGIILLALLLKKVGMFKKEDFLLISRISLNVTLTAAIITNFANKELDLGVLLMAVIGLLFACVLMFVSWLSVCHGSPEDQAFSIVNIGGVNIGNFCLPFAQSFFGAAGLIAISLFDVGNSLVCLGGSYAVAKMIQDREKHFSLLPILKTMSHSIPLMTDVIMVILCLTKVPIPDVVTQFTGNIASANPFMAMFGIGIGFHIEANAEQLKSIGRILLIRYGIAIPLAIAAYLWFPFPLEWRQAMAILFVGPIAAAAPPFTSKLGGDYGLSSALNSISMVISITLITIVLMIIL